MKKYLILLLVAGLFSLASCSSDDDGTDRQDPIVGTWRLVEVSPATINIDECDQASTITFNENNTGSATFYFAEANCTATPGAGAWSNEGNDTYSITVPLLGSVTGAVEFSGADTFFFVSDEGVTFTFEKMAPMATDGNW